jgi:type I restriction enzyme S subunit
MTATVFRLGPIDAESQLDSRGTKMMLLGDVVEFLDHKRRPITSKDRIAGPIPYYGANGRQGSVAGYIFDEPLVLLAEDGGHFDDPSRGIAYRVSGKTWVNNHAHVLRPSQQVDVNYLARVLENYDVRPFLTGTTRGKLTKAGAQRISIPLPPLDEQRRIAAILDKADELRTKRRHALAKIDVLAQSIFHNMFGDPIASARWSDFALNDLLSAIESGQSPVCEDRPAEAEEWGVLKLSAITKLTFDETQNKALTSLAPNKQHEVRQGDLLFSRKNTRALVAAVALVGEVRGRLLLPDLIFRLCIRNHAVITPEYLYAVLAEPTKRAQIQNLAGGSSGSMPNISKAKLLTVKIPTPPMELQQEFGRRVSAVERLKGRQRSQLAELEALFTSLQHRAFSGEL